MIRLSHMRRLPAVMRTRRFLSTEQYQKLADDALEEICESYEGLIEQYPEVDTDLAQGVLTVVAPPIGTYVINKQPPNKQIWLSSPISGPRRFDYDENAGKWVNLRDNGTLGALLREEVLSAFKYELPLELDR